MRDGKWRMLVLLEGSREGNETVLRIGVSRIRQEEELARGWWKRNPERVVRPGRISKPVPNGNSLVGAKKKPIGQQHIAKLVGHHGGQIAIHKELKWPRVGVAVGVPSF